MSADPRVGTEIAGYRIERPLGRGGMSIVYLAEHLRLRRKVAFKILSPELSHDEAFRTRFIRESEAAASLDHPNIIPIFEAGEADDALFIAMRYVKTTDLAALLGKRGRLDLPHTVSIVEQTASALDAAHSEGLVHRDVKPANLLVAVGAGPGGTDHVYLSDFGLTKRTATQSGLTRTGSFMGTLDYVPPEQIKGQDLDGRSDQYALACVLYQCLTGHVPFDRQDEAAVLYAHLSEPPPTVTAMRQDLPVEIDAVVVRGMAKEPADRFSTCGDLANALRAAAGMAERTVTLPRAELASAVAGGTVDPTRVAPPPTAAADPPRVPPSAPPAVPPPAPVQEPKAPVPSRGRNRTGLIAAAVAAIVLIGIGLLLLPRRGGEEEAASPSASAVAEPSSEPSPTEEPSPEPSPTEEPSPEPPPVNPLVGRWVGTDADGSTNRLTIRRDGSLRLTDDNALACSPDGFIVIDDVGEFRKRQGRDQLILRDAFADCQQGSGDLTIPELIIEHDPVTDTVRSVNEPPPGTIYRRV